MKLKENIMVDGNSTTKSVSYLNESLPDPLTEPKKLLVKILELAQIEQHVPISSLRQWLGRPDKVMMHATFGFITLLQTSCSKSLVADCQRAKNRVMGETSVQNAEKRRSRLPPARTFWITLTKLRS